MRRGCGDLFFEFFDALGGGGMFGDEFLGFGFFIGGGLHVVERSPVHFQEFGPIGLGVVGSVLELLDLGGQRVGIQLVGFGRRWCWASTAEDFSLGAEEVFASLVALPTAGFALCELGAVAGCAVSG